MNISKNIVIIPARGGSKRLPRKNLLNLNEFPLLVHSINYAKANAGIIDKIVVSTDDSEIKELAIQNGVEVIDRPSHLATDTSPTVTALKHVLENINEDFENVILLQPTNPLRPVNLLREAFQKYNAGGYDSLVSVSRNHQKLGKIIENKFVPFNYEIGQRSQDIAPLYYENGLLYITKSELILREQILGKNHFAYIVDHPFGEIDIDTQEDFLIAEMYAKLYTDDL
ncbi:MAG TPA: acylneuraminate cytidylyltransferase family protein [Salinimicrobium sp.]|nr:acylneuraminate cytidylyltransferase family protein [Salinimicrobium sp.]